ncbi:DUF3592 domain-containing protein [Rubrivirga marina]|uniref:DUF3592 domain-containing protein n=1 Tax=Rubrivirga marina TaxID=1196024 RepID=A0A271J2P4_9BACT|nr:DUF3592 domain-containing protein [Rubrivirga marina]PAP77235.1 hypothetical protein BSZ37_12730 [Rubrivirga marina]
MASAPPAQSALTLVGVGAFVLAVGAAGLLAAAGLARSGGASDGWPSIKGHVVESRVQTRVAVDGSDVSRGRVFGPRQYEHVPAVRYAYEDSGVPFTSDRVRFGERSAKRGDRGWDRAREAAGRYPAGAAVEVYYDPSRPSCSVLERGRQSTPWMPGVGALGPLAGGAFAWAGARTYARSR